MFELFTRHMWYVKKINDDPNKCHISSYPPLPAGYPQGLVDNFVFLGKNPTHESHLWMNMKL
jgi:hypothetical protein